MTNNIFVKKIVFLFILGWLSTLTLNLNAQIRKQSNDTIPKRKISVKPQTIIYPSQPNLGSIWINRESPYNNYTPEELISNVFIRDNEEDCNNISNVTFTGTGWDGNSWTSENRSLLYFSHGIMKGLENGLLLATGGALNAEGPNESTSALGGGVLIVDSDLSGMIPGYSIKSGSILQFDFIPQTDSIFFEYIFASEEYPEYVDQSYNDVFGFFISGPGITGTQNIALIPNTNIPVAINNVNDHSYSEYYKDNENSLYMEYDGHTTLLTTSVVNVISGQTYHIKLAIANVGDSQVGSGVFLKAGSFDLGFGMKNYGNMAENMDNVFAGCANNKLSIKVNSVPYPTNISLSYSGSGINDIVQLDGSPMPTNVAIPPNTDYIDIPYKVKDVVTVNGGTFIISYISSCSGLLMEKPIYVYSRAVPQLIATNACKDAGIIQATVTGGTSSVKMSIDNGNNWQHISNPFTGLASGNYTILFNDSISCHVDTLYAVIDNIEPVMNPITDEITCSGKQMPEINFSSSMLGITFTWTNDNTSIGLASAGENNIPSFTASNTTNADIVANITVTPFYNGCTGVSDSFTITVNPVIHGIINASTCLNQTYNQNNFNIIPEQTGEFTFMRSDKTINGCDSITTLILTVNPIYTETKNATICLGDNYDLYGFNITPTAAGKFTFVNNDTTINGCDSITTLLLQVNSSYHDTIYETICLGDRYFSYNFDETPTQAGNFTFIHDEITTKGCDSITTLLLTVNISYHDTVKATICLDEYYNDYLFNIIPTTAGFFTYIHDDSTSNNCDSITVLQLTINPIYDEYISARIYEDEFYTVGNYNYNTPGLHISNLETFNGCDSIVNLNLQVIYYPPEITAFSPLNKDGVNDYFMPGFKVQIFNRHGALIYETHTVEELELGWDGRNSRKQDVEPGLYFYILYNPNGKPRTKSSVEVLKK